MRFFRRNESTGENLRPIDGVVRSGKKAILSLREKVWKIEISPRILQEFWQKRKLSISGFLAIVLAVIVIAATSRSHANVANFYVSNCLGGWENTSNATGEPTLPNDAEATQFNPDNSAVLSNSQGDLYCGGFKGELPDNAVAANISLAIRWTLDDGDVDHSVKADSDLVNIVHDEVLQPEATEETPAPADSVDNPILLPIEIIPDNAEEPQQEQPQQEESRPETFNYFGIRTAHAQEDAPEAEIIVTEEEVLPTAAEQENDIVPTEVVPEETNTTATQQDFMAIEFSTDGTLWKEFARINRSNWTAGSFAFPDGILAWEDIPTLQVRIVMLASFDSPKVIYIDSLWLEVTYENVDPDPLPQPNFSKDTLLLYKENEGTLAILIDREGTPMLWFANIEDGETFSAYKTARAQEKKETVDPVITIEPEIKSDAEVSPDAIKEKAETSLEQFEEEKETVADSPVETIPVDSEIAAFVHAKKLSWTLAATEPLLESASSISVYSSFLFWISPDQKSFFGYNVKTNGIFSQSYNDGAASTALDFTGSAGENMTVQFIFADSSFQFSQRNESMTE